MYSIPRSYVHLKLANLWFQRGNNHPSSHTGIEKYISNYSKMTGLPWFAYFGELVCEYLGKLWCNKEDHRPYSWTIFRLVT